MSIPSRKPKMLVIVGPTASGKSALAVKLAKKFGGEVVSADSRQVYKGLDIGSGKITKKEMRGVPHHLLDVASPKRTFTVVEYQKLGMRAIRGILKRGKLPIVVGGTGFYIDALLYNWKLPQVKPDARIRRALAAKSAAELFRTLAHIDPRRAKSIDPHNKRRLVRALEIVIQTGKPVPPFTRTPARQSPPWADDGGNSRIVKYQALKIGLWVPAKKLKLNIKKRLANRLSRGMLREVKSLRSRGISWNRLKSLGLEYRHASRYLRGLISKGEMIEEIEKETWRYIKRQFTWWKKDRDILWIRNAAEATRATQRFLR